MYIKTYRNNRITLLSGEPIHFRLSTINHRLLPLYWTYCNSNAIYSDLKNLKGDEDEDDDDDEYHISKPDAIDEEDEIMPVVGSPLRLTQIHVRNWNTEYGPYAH